MMILVGGEKGGRGKICLDQNLAVYFAGNKKAIVLMVACDPLRTTSDWRQIRNENPTITTIKSTQI